jgi:hypothetical protein
LLSTADLVPFDLNQNRGRPRQRSARLVPLPMQPGKPCPVFGCVGKAGLHYSSRDRWVPVRFADAIRPG